MSRCKACVAATKTAKGLAENPAYHQTKQDLKSGLKKHACTGCDTKKALTEFYAKAKSVTTLCRSCQLEDQARKRLEASPALAEKRSLELVGERGVLVA